MAEEIESKPRWREWFEQLFADERDDDSADKFKKAIKEFASEEIESADTLKIIFGALHVADMRVRDIMVPRARMAYVRADSNRQQILAQIAKSQHTRFPVIGEDVDDIRGILHAKDLLIDANVKNDNGFDVARISRPPSLIPESKRLNVLLKDFRSSRRHMAIVVDEFGHVSGLVTIEDILEQIVGNIEDEHDQSDYEDQSIVPLADHQFRVRGDASIDEFNEYFKVDLPRGELETVGGVITRKFGRVPANGDELQIGAMKVRVINADDRKITLLQVIQP